jgi:hypothetical protein
MIQQFAVLARAGRKKKQQQKNDGTRTDVVAILFCFVFS